MDFNLKFYLITSCMLVGTTVAYFYLPIFTIEGEEGRKTPHQYVRYQFLETGKNLPKKTKTDWIGPEEKENSVPSGTENGRGEGENSVSLLGKIFHRILPRSLFQNPKKESREMWEAREKESLEQQAREEVAREQTVNFKQKFGQLDLEIKKAVTIKKEIGVGITKKKDPDQLLAQLDTLTNQLRLIEILESELRENKDVNYLTIPGFQRRFESMINTKITVRDSYKGLEKAVLEAGINKEKKEAMEKEMRDQEFWEAPQKSSSTPEKISLSFPKKETTREEIEAFKTNFTSLRDTSVAAKNLRNEIKADIKNGMDIENGINLKEFRRKVDEFEGQIKLMESYEKQINQIDVYYHQTIPNFQEDFSLIVNFLESAKKSLEQLNQKYPRIDPENSDRNTDPNPLEKGKGKGDSTISNRNPDPKTESTSGIQKGFLDNPQKPSPAKVDPNPDQKSFLSKIVDQIQDPNMIQPNESGFQLLMIFKSHVLQLDNLAQVKTRNPTWKKDIEDKIQVCEAYLKKVKEETFQDQSSKIKQAAEMTKKEYIESYQNSLNFVKTLFQQEGLESVSGSYASGFEESIDLDGMIETGIFEMSVYFAMLFPLLIIFLSKISKK